ncbi:hypothetical protein E2O24_00840 [Campylobacter volucris]|uniref:hypothetical protein n=1 Tax=Campylobacter volucris TaxID=1031542 RepID=UPI00105A98AA|nr:hypothetical protein [Campylobacter volucris]TDJ87686.1 hypothetical protein E2O24_00840 [Campylobacter volucris]
MVEIRFARLEEANKIMEFVKNHWNENHVFAHSKKALDFQYLDKNEKRYNIVLGLDNGEIVGFLGFTYTKQYYTYANNPKSIWLALWKVKEKYIGLGIKLMYYIFNNIKPYQIGAVGISTKVLSFYKRMKFNKIDKLKHFYIKNDKKDNFYIADFKNSPLINYIKNYNFTYKILTLDEFEKSNIKFNFIPYKSKQYFINRYYKNPFYEYQFLGIFEKSILKCIFVIRKISIYNSKCVRIVDFIGNFTENIYSLFQEFLIQNNYEYIDFLCHVNDFSKITNMGFIEKNKEIITNYFEPFIKENQDIYFAYKCEDKNYAFFKGDSDQDRINKL